MPALSDLNPGQSAAIVALNGEPAMVQRLYEFGLLEGETVELLARAPLGDPLEVRIGNTRLTLRRTDAAGVTVDPIPPAGPSH
jgi:ferrous iron transport protein A